MKNEKNRQERIGCSKADEAGGLTPVKEDNAAAAYFNRQTFEIFKWFDYIIKYEKQKLRKH